MYKRAFLAVQYLDGGETFKAWDVVDVPWPPTRDDLKEKAEAIAGLSGCTFHARRAARVIITSITWVSDVREE